MKSLLVIPLALLNAPLVWVVAQVTSFEVSLADAVAIGGVASVIPSLFMVWAGITVRRMNTLHRDYAEKMRPWREEVLQRLTGVETIVRNCDVSEFRKEIVQVLHGKTDEYQASISELELRVSELEKEG